MAVPKKPQPAFEVLLDGKGVYPERVPLRSLSRALAAVQRLAVGHGTPAEDEDSGETPFGLLQVRRGSAVYQFATQHADAALANLRATGRVLGDPEQIGDREFILSPLDDLSAVAKS